MAPPSRIRLGTASPGSQPTTADTLAQLEHFARRAAAKNIDILLLPEAYIGGYPRGTHFGCLIGSRSPEGRDEYLRYFHSAVDLGDTVGDGGGAGQGWINRELPGAQVSPGPDVGKQAPNRRGDGTREELERIARETRVFIVTGVIEKAGGSLYCCAVYVCPKQGIIGKRRKVMPTGTERLVWAQGSPATLRAVSTTIRGIRINLAAAICWENYMPLLRQSLYAQNINLYLAPTADGRDTWISLLRTVAIEGRCFVLSSNMCVRSQEANQPTTTTAPITTTNGHTTTSPGPASDSDASDIDPLSTTPHHRPAPRRPSCVTKDGFEIALPSPTTSRHASTAPPDHRRHSILDPDGNEIALPSTPYSPTTTALPRREPAPDSSSNEPAPPPPSRGRRARRQSILDEDGNEIVLCCAAKEDTLLPQPQPTVSTTETEKGAFVSRGGSAIVSPFGDVLAGPQWEDDEGLIFADVDFQDCIRGRLDLDAAGSYSRNNSFRLEVRGLEMDALPY
ncbi:carbon-nitrogen hydrolase [Staphylotrichum tortipilum]|uniref:Carbon-nitrogen hydrolase n=1 Tax=Staphylotrichum tortipilum TaxID=2831512 RepID=A0AAN6MJW5_9PEZI|nr:carbon-nitrogen hydrolase [Staphylotrichum longicolle]